MKKLRDILARMLPMAFVMGLWSCSSTAEPEPDQPHGELRLSLTIKAPQSGEAAGTPSGSYNPGTGFENYIGIEYNDFAVYLIDETANTLLSKVDLHILSVTSSTAPYKSYRLFFTIDSELYSRLNKKSVKVMFLANWGTYPEVPKGTSLADMVNHANAVKAFAPFGAQVSETERIPMFGIKRFDNLVLEAGKTFELGALNLLRAYAKTEIIDKPSASEKHSIKKVELLRYCDSAAKAPYGVDDESDYVKNDWNLDYGAAPSIPQTARIVDSLTPFGRVGDDTNHSFVVFSPEYRNTGVADESKSRIKITYTDDREYFIDYKDYTTGNAFDVRRNYYYRFTVSRKFDATAELKVTVQVVPYSQVVLDPSFGLVIGKGFMPIFNDLGVIVYYYDPETGQYYRDIEGTQPVEQPYPGFSEDPVEGWAIVRDDQGNFRYYQDKNTGQCYDINRKPIPNPDA